MRGKVFSRKWHLHAVPTTNNLMATETALWINNKDYTFYTKLMAQSTAVDLMSMFFGKVFVTVVR